MKGRVRNDHAFFFYPSQEILGHLFSFFVTS